MSLKFLPKKVGNDLKADAKAIYHAIDAANGGAFSIIKESIAKSYQGFLDAKFNNLILDMANNDVSTDELLKFINSSSHADREFMSNLIIKNLHADNRITTFLLAKLSKNKIKNGSLNYYESSLFTNINTFTHEDFEIYYYAIQHMIQPEKINMAPYLLIPIEDEHYIFAIDKFCSFGILQTANTIDGRYDKKDNQIKIFFLKTPYSDTLYQILDKYFKNTPLS
ncbi:hypothetical protein [Sulfurospirillum sp. hDNRA2]|uniref:hypothetical protein n=1 Tax=Sulfurospirillum sp. hDNRA2 TaxID=3237298 RepID=UPI0020B8EC19|nr:hypothetical protein [Sulfurospirillum sp. DNRA8]MCP3652781.1 hypothetical protein [Sulfurospirillum sp. DNRA8]MCR1811633.1 hypothetical protein [Sulfurospirillum sp. DNRA8]